MTFDDVSRAVQERVSYLRCRTVAPAADGWLACAELIADPVTLRAAIDATAVGRGTTDPQVAASLFAQAYAFRVPSISVAAWALGLPVPSLMPEAQAIRITRSRPGELAVLADGLETLDADQLAERLCVGHIAPFIAAIRAGTHVGERLLWGNVVASLATIFRAVQSNGPVGDPKVRERADRFFAAAEPWLGRTGDLGHWSTISTPDALGWYFDRTTCCLFYKCDNGFSCDDCSLSDPAEVAVKRRADLIASTT